jgi:putative oxidoreductase
MGFLAPHSERIYAVFRIMLGLLMLQHGTQKMLGWFGGIPAGAPAGIVYSSGTIELVGGLLVAIGLFAGLAAFIVSGTMAVAFFIGHVFNAQQNPTHSIIPLVNGGELAVAYCFSYLLIAAKGSGLWSVDAARGSK